MKERSDEMILSVSRRTDIPNYYSEWFYNRIKEGFLYAVSYTHLDVYKRQAHDLGVSKFSLSRLFSKTFHSSFNQYVNEARLGYARCV